VKGKKKRKPSTDPSISQTTEVYEGLLDLAQTLDAKGEYTRYDLFGRTAPFIWALVREACKDAARCSKPGKTTPLVSRKDLNDIVLRFAYSLKHSAHELNRLPGL